MSRSRSAWALNIMKLAIAIALVVTATGCDSTLSLVPPSLVVDEQGAGEGEGEGEGEFEPAPPTFCELQPDDVTEFPVKVLYLVDQSGSMDFTDQTGLRFGALTSHIASLPEDVEVAYIGWGAGIITFPIIQGPDDPRFVPASEFALPANSAAKDVATDMQGALAAAHEHVLSDALATDEAVRERTRYVVIMFTDGSPDPICCRTQDESVEVVDPFGCALEDWEVARPNTRYCEGRAELDLCNEQDFLDQFQDNWEEVVYPGLAIDVPDYGDGRLEGLDGIEINGNRNRVADLEESVRQLRSIEFAGVGAVDMHFALLEDGTLPTGVLEIFQLNFCRMESLMAALATAADGTAETFEGSSAMSFVDVDTAPLCPDGA